MRVTARKVVRELLRRASTSQIAAAAEEMASPEQDAPEEKKAGAKKHNAYMRFYRSLRTQASLSIIFVCQSTSCVVQPEIDAARGQCVRLSTRPC